MRLTFPLCVGFALVCAVAQGVEVLVSVEPPSTTATGGDPLKITGLGFEPALGAVYSCQFQLDNDPGRTAVSKKVAAASPTSLQCVTPEWPIFGAEVQLSLLRGDEAVGGDSLDFEFRETWSSVTPRASKSTGGDIITINGAGFDTAQEYRCRFYADGETFLYSAYSLPLRSDTLSCTTPNWAATFNTEIANIAFDVYRKDDANQPTGMTLVPRPKTPSQFFSFSVGSAGWVNAVVTSKPPAAANTGSGIIGGDVVVFSGTEFAAGDTLSKPYECKFTLGGNTAVSQPSSVTATTVTCVIPETLVTEGTATMSLGYGAFTVLPLATAKATVYGVTAIISDNTGTVPVPIRAVVTSIDVTGGILITAGGQNTAITGQGFNPATDYECVWTGSKAAVFTTPAVASSGTAMTCKSPVLGNTNNNNTPVQTYTVSVRRATVDKTVLIDTRIGNDLLPLGVGAAWYSKDPDIGGAIGGDTVTVNGVGFEGDYQCVFGTVQVAATTVSSTELACTTPANWGRTRGAGTISFTIQESSTSLVVLYTGPTVTAVENTFEFIAQWTAVTPSNGPVYSRSGSTVVVTGWGFASTAAYNCAFVKPECIAGLRNNATVDNNAGTPVWERSIDTACYIQSPTAFAITATSMRCTVPTWPYAAGTTSFTVFGRRTDDSNNNSNAPLVLRQLPRSTGQTAAALASTTEFMFRGVVTAVTPSSTDISGGTMIEVAGAGLDPEVLDYILQWRAVTAATASLVSTGATLAVTNNVTDTVTVNAVNDAVRERLLGATAYSERFSSEQLKPCSENTTAATVTALRNSIQCISVPSAAWPLEPGSTELTIVRAIDGKSGIEQPLSTFIPVSYTMSPQSPAHVRITGDIILTGPTMTMIDLTTITDIRYWLAGASGFDVWLVQLTNMTTISDAALATNSNNNNNQRRRYLQAETDGVVISVALASRSTDQYSNGAEGAQSSATAAITGIQDALNTFILPSLADVTTDTEFSDFKVTIVASDCPPGQGKLDTTEEGLSTCEICPKDTFSSGMTLCKPCGTGADCSETGTAVPAALPGYWRAPRAIQDDEYNLSDFPFHKCLTDDMCLGGPLSECPVGHVYGAPLCGVCESGYTPDTQGGVCTECPSESTIRTRFALMTTFLLLAATAALVWFINTKHMSVATALSREPSLASAIPALKKQQRVHHNGSSNGGGKERRGSASFLMPTSSSVHDNNNNVVVIGGNNTGITHDDIELTGNTGHRTVQAHTTSSSASSCDENTITKHHHHQYNNNDNSHVASSINSGMYYDDSGTVSPVTPYGIASGNTTAIRGRGQTPARTRNNNNMNNNNTHTYADSSIVSDVTASELGDMNSSIANDIEDCDDSTVTPLVLTPRTVYRVDTRLSLRRGLRAKALILIAFLHTMSAMRFGAAYWIRWPHNFASFLATLSVIDLSLLAIPTLSLKCITTDINFYDQWLLSVLFLPVLAVFLTIVWGIGRVILAAAAAKDNNNNSTTINDINNVNKPTKSSTTSTTMAAAASSSHQISETRTLQRMIFDAKFLQVFLWVTIAVYPGVSRAVLQLFQCLQLDDITNDLLTDLSVSCNGDTYAGYLGANVIALLVYPIGIPLAIGTMLHRYKVKPLTDGNRATWSLRVGFLTDPYKPHYWYWEVLDLGRRLLITGIVMFIAPATIGQLCGGALFSFFFFKVHCYFRPFAAVGDNFMAGAAQAVITLVLLCGLLAAAGVSGPRDTSGVGNVSLTLCIIFLAILLPLSLLYEVPLFKRAVRDKLEQMGVYKAEAGTGGFPHEKPLHKSNVNSGTNVNHSGAASAASYRNTILKMLPGHHNPHKNGVNSNPSSTGDEEVISTDNLSSSPTWKWEGTNNGDTSNNTDSNNENSKLSRNSSNKTKKSAVSDKNINDKNGFELPAVPIRSAASAYNSSNSNRKGSSNSKLHGGSSNSVQSGKSGLSLAHFLAIADSNGNNHNTSTQNNNHNHSHIHSKNTSGNVSGNASVRNGGIDSSNMTPIAGSDTWVFPDSHDLSLQQQQQQQQRSSVMTSTNRSSFDGSDLLNDNDHDNTGDGVASSAGFMYNGHPVSDLDADHMSIHSSEVELPHWRKSMGATVNETATEAAKDARIRGLQMAQAASIKQQQQQQSLQRSASARGSSKFNTNDVSTRVPRNSHARNNTTTNAPSRSRSNAGSVGARSNRGHSTGTASRNNSGNRGNNNHNNDANSHTDQDSDTGIGFNYDTMGSFVYSPQYIDSTSSLPQTFGSTSRGRNSFNSYDNELEYDENTPRSIANNRHNSRTRVNSSNTNASRHHTVQQSVDSINGSSIAHDDSISIRDHIINNDNNDLISQDASSVVVSPTHSNAPSSTFEAIHGASDEIYGTSGDTTSTLDSSPPRQTSRLSSAGQTPMDIKRHPRRPLFQG